MDKLQLQQSLGKALPAPRISTGLFLLLLCLIAYQLAGLSWLLFPPAETSFSWTPTRSKDQQQTQGLDLSKLKEEHLFGHYQANAPTKPVVNKSNNEDAPKTKLKLDLTGLVYSNDQQRALAIISHRKQELAYGIGESIQGTKAVIDEILLDRVILDNQGQTESLFLDEEAKNNPANSRRSNNKPAGNINSSAGSKIQAALKNPAKLSDLISYSVIREKNELKGYRVNPGKDRELFKQVGLKPGDLAVALNGYDLRDTAQAMQIMKDLNNLSEITVTVERDGQLEDIFLALPEE